MQPSMKNYGNCGSLLSPSAENSDDYVESALNQKQSGSAFPFVVLDKTMGHDRFDQIL